MRELEKSAKSLVIPTTELAKPKIGIYSETHKLKTVAIWGELGAEASLAQLYPPDKSLFFGDMDVVKAGEEAKSFSRVLKNKGVTVYKVRDELAKILPDTKLKKNEVVNALLSKAKQIQVESGISKPQISNEITELLERDIENYGQDKALMLNKVLSLDPEMPMGNLIYARDQMNVLLGTRFQSTMAQPIRKPEVSIYEAVYQKALGLPKPLMMPPGETFEGGDAYVHDAIVYVGVGSRTTMGAAKHIYSSLKTDLKDLDFQFAVVEDPMANKRTFKEQMDFMHLDTFSMPDGPNQITACEGEAARRRVLLASRKGDKLIDTGLSFLGFLKKTGQDVIPVPSEEQQFFGCNYLNLDKQTAVVPLESNKLTNGKLKQVGKIVEFVNLQESTKGYGGAHCMTGQLLRKF